MATKFADEAAKSVTESTVAGLSQLTARVLAQLSLSAWLPSAALVLLMAVAFRLADVLNDHSRAVEVATKNNSAPPNPPGLTEWLVEGISRLGNMGVVDLALVILAVIVSTMLTQAFAFESIRILEGYWGSWLLVEWVARACCYYFRMRLRLVRWREGRLLRAAWAGAESEMRELLQANLLGRGWSSKLVDQLRREVLLEEGSARLTKRERRLIDDYKWRDHAAPDLLRRLKNVEKKLSDYPSVGNLQPTRLGNVLRHYEEATGIESIESLVDEVFDRLPFALQLSHDDQRGRLDLYCSMTFVWLFFGASGAALLNWGTHPAHAASLVAVALLAALVTYRAAIASARYYGVLLLTIARYHPQTGHQEQSRPVWWRRLREAVGLGGL